MVLSELMLFTLVLLLGFVVELISVALLFEVLLVLELMAMPSVDSFNILAATSNS